MSNARTMTRWSWLLISGATSGCVLRDYDLGRGPRAGSAGISSSDGGSQARASSGSTSNQGGTGGTAFGGISTGGVMSPQTGSSFGTADHSAQGGTSANSLVAAVGGTLSSGGSSRTLSSANSAGGSVGTSVNGTGTSALQGGSSSGGTATGTSSGSGGTASGGTASGGTASGGTASGGTAVAGAPNTGTQPCPSGRGPDMLRVPEGYCIDKTEVTEGQYTAWMNTNPVAAPANQRAECAWNNDYASSYLREVANYPVAGVDWCDAVAFCTWANKRLCGAIGGGALNYFTGSDNENESQWYNACSAHGANVYPYGDDIQDAWCNAGKAGVATVAPVGEFKRCASSVPGYTEILDMSGNVSEWLDSCNGTAASDFCRVGGGSYIVGTDPDPRCALPAYEFRNNWYYNVGFRCCAD